MRYASLGISEYFVFDCTRTTLHAYRLAPNGEYERLAPHAGRSMFNVLGLELSVDGDKLRFSVGDALRLVNAELLTKLGSLVNDAEQRAVELEAALEGEQRRRERAEHELKALRAELERVRQVGE